MFAIAYGIALGITIVCGFVAVYLQRRFPERVFATALASVVWSMVLLVAFRLVTGRPAPYFWTEDGAGAEPWERLAFSVALVSLLWPALHAFARHSPGLELWLALTAGTLPLVVALPAGEAYLDVLPGNATWSVAALLAIGANWLAGERFVLTGGGRWSLWVFVAQLLTVSALLMTCYATLAEWCLSMGMSLAVLATCRVFVKSGQWTSALALPSSVLSCSLLTHVRIYSADVLPLWLLALPMLSPVLVCGVDRLVTSKCGDRYRVAIAAVSAALIAVAVIVTAMAPSRAEW